MAVKGRIFFTPGGPLGDALPDTASGGAAALRQVPRRQSGAVSSYMASLTEPEPEPEPGANFFVGAQTALGAERPSIPHPYTAYTLACAAQTNTLADDYDRRKSPRWRSACQPSHEPPSPGVCKLSRSSSGPPSPGSPLPAPAGPAADPRTPEAPTTPTTSAV